MPEENRVIPSEFWRKIISNLTAKLSIKCEAEQRHFWICSLKKFSSYTLCLKKLLEGRSQDGRLGGCGICLSAQLGHLPGTGRGPQTPRGTGGTPSNWVGRVGWGGVRGRRSGGRTGLAPRGVAGGGEEIPRPKGEIGGPLGGQRIKRERGQVSPAHLGLREPAEILGLILCPRVLREWEGGMGSKSKGQTYGPAPLTGGWGRGGVPTPSRTHPRLGVQRGWGRPWGRQWRRGVKEWKGTGPVLSLFR